jgi:hypothetical protein
MTERSLSVVLLIGASCLVASCGSFGGDARMTAAEITNAPTPGLCDRVKDATLDKDALLLELTQRRAVRDQYLADIRGGTVEPGMNSCEAIAAWGPPATFSSTPGVDYHANAAIVGAAQVYDYGARGKIGFGTNGLVTTVVR